VAACDDGARAKLTSGGGATQAVPGRSSRAAVVGHGRRAGELTSGGGGTGLVAAAAGLEAACGGG
jgi:hypothetical protein